MKKVIFMKVFMAFCAMLAFSFLGVEQVAAQSNTLVSSTGASGTSAAAKDLMTIPTGNFVGASQAQILIAQKMEQIKLDMLTAGLPPSAIVALEKQHLFYQILDENIKSGSTIPNAIVVAALTMTSMDEGVTQPVAVGFKQEATNLLKI